MEETFVEFLHLTVNFLYTNVSTIYPTVIIILLVNAVFILLIVSTKCI